MFGLERKREKKPKMYGSHSLFVTSLYCRERGEKWLSLSFSSNTFALEYECYFFHPMPFSRALQKLPNCPPKNKIRKTKDGSGLYIPDRFEV